MIHEVSPVAFHLFIGGDGAEDDFGKALRWKHSEANSAYDARVFNECQTLVLWIENQPGDVLLGHSRELMRKYILHPDQPRDRLTRGRVVEGIANDVEFDDAAAFFRPRRLVTR